MASLGPYAAMASKARGQIELEATCYDVRTFGTVMPQSGKPLQADTSGKPLKASTKT